METNTTNQQSQPNSSLPQMQPSLNPTSNQKGNFLIPIGITFLILIVGAGAYYLSTRQKQSITQDKQNITVSPTATTQNLPTAPPILDTTANWRTYNNQKLGISVKYPSDLFIKEFETSTSFTFEPYPTGEGPGPLDLIEISLRGSYVSQAFTALYKASQGDDVPEAHNAVDVKVTKLKNLKFGNYTAVEYIRDGLTPPKSGLGRGPIGYEHHVLIKKSEQEFIDLINQNMDVEKTKQRDVIFNEMITSFSIR